MHCNEVKAREPVNNLVLTCSLKLIDSCDLSSYLLYPASLMLLSSAGPEEP